MNVSADFSMEIGAHLLERLDFIRIQPKLIVDLGAKTEQLRRLLAKRYRKAKVLAVDNEWSALHEAKKHVGWFSRQYFINADVMQLPFRDHSVDFIFFNLLLPSPQLWQKFSRLLTPDGLLLFSICGDSIDIQAIGDDLLRAGLREPVVDRDVGVTRGRPLEMIYGIGWGADVLDSSSDPLTRGEVAIPIKKIKRR